MAESKRPRSKAYPQHSLKDMVEGLRRISSQLGPGPYDRASIAEGLGHSAGSGTANSKAAALVHFGLLDRRSNAYHLSPLATQLLHPTSEDEVPAALVAAVKSPTLFEALFEKFEDRSLPNLLPNILARDFGIMAKQSDQVSELFRDSAEYAGLLVNGILHSEIPISPSAGTRRSISEDDDSGQVDRKDAPTRLGAPSRQEKLLRADASMTEYSIPLSGGRTCSLQLPRPVSERDLSKITGWLDLMADVLTESNPEETSEATNE